MRFKNCRQPSWEFRQTASLKRGRDVKDHELSIQPRIYFEFQDSRLSEAVSIIYFPLAHLLSNVLRWRKPFPFLGQAGSQLTSLLVLVFRIFWTSFIWIKESGNFWPEKKKVFPREQATNGSIDLILLDNKSTLEDGFVVVFKVNMLCYSEKTVGQLTDLQLRHFWGSRLQMYLAHTTPMRVRRI